MRAVVVCSICVVLLACTWLSTAALTSEQDQFVQYMKAYNKKYETAEMFSRFNTFRANVARMNAHNADFAAGLSSFKMGVNAFADLTLDEYRATKLNLHSAQNGAKSAAISNMVASSTLANMGAVPAAWDWRAKGAVPAVIDWAPLCAARWADAATLALEATDFIQTGKLKTLSEQLCLDCALDGTVTCESGARPHDCMAVVNKLGGDMLEADYPYTGTPSGVCHFNASEAVGKFAKYVDVPVGDEIAMQAAAAQTVLSVGIDASSEAFQFYVSGVFDDTSCGRELKDLNMYLTVVGYGSDTGMDYWIVRNTWGSTWGMRGYILVARNKNNVCGIATDASYVPPQTRQSHRRKHLRSL